MTEPGRYPAEFHFDDSHDTVVLYMHDSGPPPVFDVHPFTVIGKIKPGRYQLVSGRRKPLVYVRENETPQEIESRERFYQFVRRMRQDVPYFVVHAV